LIKIPVCFIRTLLIVNKTFYFIFRREQQLSSVVERNDYLTDELSMERQSNSALRKKIENTVSKLEEVSNQVIRDCPVI